jgi:hypothetical protein
MGRVLLYIAGGYVALVLISSALYTGAGGLPLLIVVVIAYFLYRRGMIGKGRAQPSLTFKIDRPDALPAVDHDRNVRRLEKAEPRLAAALPADPLESASLVAVLSSYLHEPPEARARLEAEYRERYEQFIEWRGKLRSVESPAEAEELASELAELEAYVEQLQERAAEADGLLERAVERATRAGDEVGAAGRELASIDDSARADLLREQLETANTKQRDAWDALEKGRERPLSALRLADEAAEMATDVRRQAAHVKGLPNELGRQLSELRRSIDQASADLERVHEEFDAAADSYAPSCWNEIAGFGHAAQRTLVRARRLHEAAASLARTVDADELERAQQEAAAARDAVADAERLRTAIERHLAKLEAAALDGRDRVIEAEQEIDRTWSAAREAGGGGADESLQRASELVRQAREGLSAPQPDWLTIVELADRARALARDAHTGAPARVERAEAPDRSLERLQADAKDVRDSAWAKAIVRPEAAEGLRSLLDEAETAYQTALRADASAAPAAYAEAESLAAAFLREFDSLFESPTDRPGEDSRRPAHTLVWNFEFRRTGTQ